MGDWSLLGICGFRRRTLANDQMVQWRHNYDRMARFSRLTGLHGTFWFAGKTISDEEVMALQGRKIKNLEMERAQLHKGYRRKIAKLEARIKAMQVVTELTPCP